MKTIKVRDLKKNNVLLENGKRITINKVFHHNDRAIVTGSGDYFASIPLHWEVNIE